MKFSRLTIAAFLLGAAHAPLQAQSSAEVLSLEDVVTLLQTPQVSRELLGSMVRSGCVSFPVNDAAASRLRGAGADDSFVAVVRNACFTGAELAVTSQPNGAEVFVDGQRVGTTPWTGRYATAQQVQVSVRRGDRSLNATAPLQARQRVEASFAFHRDTVAVPQVPTTAAVADRLRLAQQWQPRTPAPQDPGNLRLFRGNALTTMVTLGFGAAGVAHCHSAANHCYIEPDIGDDGEDSMEYVRWLVGGAAGLAAGATVTGLLQRAINSGRRSSHQRARQARQDWERSNATARESWIRNHPDVSREITAARESRAHAIERNQQIREQNRAAQPVRVTTRPLPGPAAP